MRRFEILTTMHMGPMKRQINKGDVIGWECSTQTLTINGQEVKEAKGMDFEEVLTAYENPTKSKEIG
jgi:hypothetical protein